MRLLIAHPGANFSVSDLHDGLIAALERRADTEVIRFALDGRLEFCDKVLKAAWLANGKSRGLPKPSDIDAIYWASQGIIEKALRFQPDWIILVTGHYFFGPFLELLRRARFKTAMLFTESPYEDETQADRLPYLNLAWTNERTSLGYLGQLHPRVVYLPHAYDPGHHRPDLPDPSLPSHDVVFVGTGFIERVKLLEAIDWSGIDLGLYGIWNLVGSRSKLRKHIRGGSTPNKVAASLYHNAKIGLQLFRSSVTYGRDVAHIQYAESLGPRSLELAACGIFQISEWRAEVEELFGDSVPTFKTPDELAVLIRGWLECSLGRREQAEEARECVKSRTFDAMAAQVVADLAAS